MEKLDLIPDEAIRASFSVGDGPDDDGKPEVSVRLFLGGKEEPAFDEEILLPSADFLDGIPALQLLTRNMPDVLPEELVRFDIAIGDANRNDLPDVVTQVRFGGDEEPRIDKLREVTKAEAFDVILRLLAFLGGKGFSLGLPA